MSEPALYIYLFADGTKKFADKPPSSIESGMTYSRNPEARDRWALIDENRRKQKDAEAAEKQKQFLESEKQKAPARKTAKQLQTERYEALTASGYPVFSITPAYARRPFVRDRDVAAYRILFDYAKTQLELRLTLEEQEKTAVFGRVGFDVWACPSARAEVVQGLTALGLENADRYVKPTNKQHAVKFNLCLPNHPSLAGLDHRLQTNLPHPHLKASGTPDLSTIQIGKRSLCEQLIRDGILPEEIE